MGTALAEGAHRYFQEPPAALSRGLLPSGPPSRPGYLVRGDPRKPGTNQGQGVPEHVPCGYPSLFGGGKPQLGGKGAGGTAYGDPIYCGTPGSLYGSTGIRGAGVQAGGAALAPLFPNQGNPFGGSRFGGTCQKPASHPCRGGDSKTAGLGFYP